MSKTWACLLSLLVVAVAGSSTPPTVQLGNATVIGINDGRNNQFLGIPYAQPPVGQLRLQKPQLISQYNGVLDATTFGNRCIQQTIAPPPIPDDVPPELKAFFEGGATSTPVPQSEDCLSINVIAPAGAKPGDNLPVAAWIYGGAYEVGSNSDYPGGVVVNRSIELQQPVVYVSMNYRVNTYGFLGGREIQEAGVGNLGLQDQREALRWVQKHVASFGGDPTKVTIWGESAGAWSVMMQMLTNDGNPEGLFRAGWLESGSVLPTGDASKLQPVFDFIVSETGCESASDRLACLREVPASNFTVAMDKLPSIYDIQALSDPYLPHADGEFLKANSHQLVLEGKFADIPIVIGSCEDEGTIFSISSLNITTDAEFADYARSNFFPGASDTDVLALQQLYTADPAAGSPFGTGQDYSFSPQYKRIAAFQGDMFFQATRRFVLEQRAGKLQPVRSFLSQRDKTPGLGAEHSSDLLNVYGGGDMTDFLIRFVNTLDPNDYSTINNGTVTWPEYTSENPRLLAFQGGDTPLAVIPDTFRKEAMSFLTRLSIAHPL